MKRTIFNDEHEHFRESVRQFLEREAVPNNERWEEAGLVDREFWKKAAGQGLVAFQAPEALGGAGQTDFRFNAVIDEEVALTGAVGDNFNLTNDIVAPYLLNLTNQEQRERWIPGVTSGDRIIAIAMSEPGAGSDLRGMTTKAKRDGDSWRITGSKTFVSNGIQADLIVVAAYVDDGETQGMGLFGVEADMEGFERGRKLGKVGRKAQDTAELFLEDVAVPAENVIGELGKGLNHLMSNLPQERLSMAVTGVAAAERALAITLDYCRDRNAFGKPIGSFQANRFTLADLHTEIQVARAYTDTCIAAHAEGELTAV
jgi:alkylation response protein AidB-like acyl-CoA dehydrogenase